VSLWSTVLLIGLFNLMTLGSGSMMIPLLQEQFVEGRHVLTQDQLLYAFTIARVTPGQNNMYVASIGYMLHGLVGAVLALVAITVPGYLMIAALKGYDTLRHSARVRGIVHGLTVTSVGLIFASAAQIARGALTDATGWVVFAAMLVMTQWLKWNILVALGAACAIGVLIRVL
jgi:chromate transporter